MVLEFIRRERYLLRDYQFYFLSTEKNELDLIIERPGRNLACIEIKSTTKVNEHTIRKMNFFLDVFPEADFFCLSRDKNVQNFGRIKSLPWSQGLAEI